MAALRGDICFRYLKQFILVFTVITFVSVNLLVSTSMKLLGKMETYLNPNNARIVVRIFKLPSSVDTNEIVLMLVLISKL
jgi:hypothetical protein